MLFTEPAFLFFFLPATLLLDRAVPRRWSNLLLAVLSGLFYAVGELRFLGWLLASTVVTYAIGRAVIAWRGRPRAKVALAVGIAVDLLLLGYFKYAGFLVGSLDRLLEALALPSVAVPAVLLPLGISFFTFHKISFKVDAFRGLVPPEATFVDVLLYILFFPQLIAGPIVRFHDISGELIHRRLTSADFSSGVRRFVVGFAKKMLVANPLGLVADQVFKLEPERLGTAGAWTGLVCYTLQIYFDFSGYSDMAIGLARMFGFHFLENFDFPYISRSVTEFWRRWHISLSRWFRDYVYIPLGGNRRSSRRTYLNLGAVFLFCGLWHGASWTFVLWGAMHGGLLIAERAGWGRVLSRLPVAVQHLQTLAWVMLAWVVFRAESFGQAVAYYRALLGRGAQENAYQVLSALTPGVVLALTVAIIGSTPAVLEVAGRLRSGLGLRPAGSMTWIRDGAVLALLLLSVMEVASGTYNPFIYFRF